MTITLLACGCSQVFAAPPPPLATPDFSPEPALGAEYLGTFSGEASVSAGGNASYSLPLEIPPGTSGMAPTLSINYNSNMRNGLLGLGWFMRGASSTITRCPRNLSQDGQIRAVDYTAQDRFCLDGNRLVAVAGSYGADGTQYRTEIDRFSRIISHGVAGVGPAYFTVETKDGLIQHYGHSDDSRIEAYSRDDVRVWAMNRSQDRLGNYYSIEYFENPSSRQYYATRINYTGNDQAGLAPYASIIFKYEDRSDWSVIKYSGGYEYRLHPARLTNIQSYVDDNLVGDYRLAYEEIGADKRSRLTRIERCDAAGSCQKPIDLEWRSSSTTFSAYDLSLPATVGETPTATMPRWHDFNGDGRPDYIRSVYPSQYSAQSLEIALSGPDGYDTQVWPLNFDGASYFFIWSDINGDGRTDILSKKKSGLTTTYNVALSNGSGFDSQNWAGHTRNSWSKSTAYYLRDMNGDRLLDLVARESSSDSNAMFVDCYGTYRSKIRNYYYYYVHLNEGDGFGAPELWLNKAQDAQLSGDFNGDGLVDIIEQTRYVRINTGAGFGPPQDWGSFGHHNCSTGGYSATYNDQNGDGLIDRLVDGELQVNTGRTFKPIGKPALAAVTDFDGNNFGDSYLRSHNAYSGDTQLYFMLSVDQFGQSQRYAHSQSLYGFNRFQQVADINGDGLTDYTAAWTYVSDPGDSHGHYTATWAESGAIRVWQNRGDHYHLLESIRSGLGKRVEFTYKALTEPGVHKKYHDATLPTLDVQDSSVQVVVKISRSNGNGGLYHVTYDYAGMKRDLGGRGNLGFAKINAYDLQRDTKTATFYAQSFPYSMQPTRRVVRRNSDRLLLRETDIAYSVHGETGNGPVFPCLDSQVQSHYDPADGRKLSTSKTTTQCDDFGNITSRVVSTEDFENAITHRRQTINEFDTDESNWQIARALSRQQKYWLNGTGDPSADQLSDYTYFTDSGLLQSVTHNAGKGAGIQVDKTVSYDIYGNPTSETLAGPGLPPRTTTMTYDQRGQFALVTTNPLGHRVASTWDKRFGTKLGLTDANGQTTRWLYDSFGRTVSQQNPDGTVAATRTYEDNSGDNHPAVSYSEVIVTGAAPIREFHDRLGRVVRRRTQAFQGRHVNQDTRYDSAARIYRESEPYFDGDSIGWNTTSYDSSSRVIALDAADPTNSSAIHYDGFNVSTTDAGGQTTTRTLNALDQVIATADALGTRMEITYDAAGNRIRVLNAAGTARQNSVSYYYDRLGRMISQVDPNHGSYHYTYNALGQKLTEVSPRLAALGQQMEMQYDLLGRLVKRIEPEGVTAWAYDNESKGNLGLGQLHSESSPDFSRSYSYAPGNFGRLTGTRTTIIDSIYTTSRTYDAFGRLATEKYPASPGTSGFTVQYLYNGSGRLERVQAPGGARIYYQLIDTNAAGNITEEWLGDGSWASNAFEVHSGRLASQQTVNGSHNIQQLHYRYDHGGNMTAREDLVANLAESFSFDDMNRLTSAQVNDHVPISYTFDALGNITEKSDKGSPFMYTSSKVHALTRIQIGNTNRKLHYDGNGNFTHGRKSPSISWTSYNKPLIISKGNDSYSFNYGPDRRRFKKVHNGLLTHYVGDNFEKIFHPTSAEYRHYIRANGRIIMLHRNLTGSATNEYIHRDHLGSITAVTAESDGRVIRKYSYDAWGRRRSSIDWQSPLSSDSQHRGYTGHEHLDAVGLIHMNGRLYDPTLGRMLSPDPVTQAPEDGQNYNRYTYALNNPLRYTDPSGYQISELTGSTSGLAVSGTAGSVIGLSVLARSTSQYSVVEFRENILSLENSNDIPFYRLEVKPGDLGVGVSDIGKEQPLRRGEISISEHRDDISVDEANEILSSAYWIGLRGGFGVNIGIASFNINVNAVSHECAYGTTCDGNSITQGIVISGTIRGADVEVTLIDVTRSSSDSMTWSDFQFSGPSVTIGPARIGNGRLIIGIKGGLLIGGSIEYDVGRFITEQVYGTCHGGARCQSR